MASERRNKDRNVSVPPKRRKNGTKRCTARPSAKKARIPAGIEVSFEFAGRFRITRRAVERFIAGLIIVAALTGFGGGSGPRELPPSDGPRQSDHSLGCTHRAGFIETWPEVRTRPFGGE